MTDPVTLPRARVAEEITDAARAREVTDGFPAERIARIRAAAARLGATELAAGDVRHAALLLEHQADIDLQVPTASRAPGVHVVKRVLKALMIWYLRFLASQITAFGHGVARFGITVATRIDGLEAEVEDLRRRVERLESSAGSSGT